MKMRLVLPVLMPALILLSAAYIGARSGQDGGSEAAPDPGREFNIAPLALAAPAPGANIAVLYVHGTVRCATCNQIEAAVEQTVTTHFAGELSSGQMVWRSLNSDLPEQAGLVKAFRLFSSAVVLARIQDGVYVSCRQLPKVWELANDEAALQTYIQDEIEAFLAS